jgi:hypothetical protein
MNPMEKNLPLPPFTMETARQKVIQAEILWNSRSIEEISKACTIDTEWQDRTEFINGQEHVKTFLTDKWNKERNYTLKNALWGFRENRMAVKFEYEWHNASGQWFRSFGNELLEFDNYGLLAKRYANSNDLAIDISERSFK